MKNYFARFILSVQGLSDLKNIPSQVIKLSGQIHMPTCTTIQYSICQASYLPAYPCSCWICSHLPYVTTDTRAFRVTNLQGRGNHMESAPRTGERILSCV